MKTSSTFFPSLHQNSSSCSSSHKTLCSSVCCPERPLCHYLCQIYGIWSLLALSFLARHNMLCLTCHGLFISPCFGRIPWKWRQLLVCSAAAQLFSEKRSVTTHFWFWCFCLVCQSKYFLNCSVINCHLTHIKVALRKFKIDLPCMFLFSYLQNLILL